MRTKQAKTRLSACFLALLLIVLTPASALPAYAAEPEVKQTTVSHDIAVVFDNSKSMYTDDYGAPLDRWSQALYAVGVFASMLNYDAGDKLGIYPMGSISVGKNGEDVTERLDINRNNIGDISKIYCKSTSETILKPAYDAQEYLKQSQLDEKWLIVMTDGKFFFDKSTSEAREEKSADWLNSRMLGLAENDIRVQYLGFGEAAALQSNISNNFYASNVGSADMLSGELVDICNRIFQRQKVTDISDGKFNIDVSMNSIVAFAQGKGAQIRSLKSSDGAAMNVAIDERVSAGSEGAGNVSQCPAADVSGQVVTFNDCKAGSYQLSYTGSDVEVFYEPNVRIDTFLTDADGKKLDGSEPVNPGEYTVNVELVDAVTGEDVTGSPLLDPVRFKASVKNGGSEQEISPGQKITLDADADTKINVSASFLDKYEITNEDDAQSGAFNVKAPEEKKLQVKLDTEQLGAWFKTSEYETWKPVRLSVTYDGKKLTDEELEAVTIDLTPTPDEKLTYTVTPLKGESACEIRLGMNAKGEYVEPACGRYKMEAKASFTDPYGRELTAEDSIRFDVEWFSKFWVWLFWLIIAAVVILLILFIMNLPAWPAKITCEILAPANAKGRYPVTPGVGMTLVPYKWPLGCTAKKASKVWNKLFRRGGKILIVDVSPDRHVDAYSFGAQSYSKGDKFKPVTIGSSKTVEMNLTNGDDVKAIIRIK